LARFSAKAFSLIQRNIEEENLSRMEMLLSLLMLRRFDKLEALILEWKNNGLASDETLASKLDVEIGQLTQIVNTDNEPEEFGISSVELPVLDLAITDNYYSSIFEFLFSLETGNKIYLEGAIRRIQNSLTICAELNLLPQWWVLRLTKHLLNDLWDSSFHKILPIESDQEHSADWVNLRWLFISSLYKRNKAEIDLWPSQPPVSD